MVSKFCSARLSKHFDREQLQSLTDYLCLLAECRLPVPDNGRGPDWECMSMLSGVEAGALRAGQATLQPIVDALQRAASGQKPTIDRSRSLAIEQVVAPAPKAPSTPRSERKKPGPRPKPKVEFPEALWAEWEEPAGLSEALKLHIARHGDTVGYLYRCITTPDDGIDKRAFFRWVDGTSAPGSVQSMAILSRVERRYRLPEGYFHAKMPRQNKATRGHVLDGFSEFDRRRMAWHLPNDLPMRSVEEQEKIIAWVEKVILRGSTEYRRFQVEAIKHKYAVRFKALNPGRRRLTLPAEDDQDEAEVEVRSAMVDAPPHLEQQMSDLLRFKMSTLTALGFQRNGVWGSETASQKVEHLGLMFGALAASPRSAVRGLGVDPKSLSFAMLAFPAVWDWYLQWRERKRGFYTAWEIDMLSIAVGMVRAETGWLRQTPRLAETLVPIEGLLSTSDISRARGHWDAVCDEMHKHGRLRIKEIQRVARVHRDPFEPILPVLEADSPVGEYRRITDEIVRLMPDERRHPIAAAEAVRSFLLLRLGLHLGLRQKNLREMLLCPRGKVPTAERLLEDQKRGELRWSERDNGWEVLIPSVAFKNANSSFFGDKPFRLVLPNLGGLYDMIDAYIGRHRRHLAGAAEDQRTFFVKTVKTKSASTAYDQTTFYEAWRLVIQRYGIHNPYTGRGAIKGLLPHGPHSVRDVLATHILKKTGSYEQASYAIQDTPDMVAKHYGRFLPQDKSAIAAKVLNRVWEDG